MRRAIAYWPHAFLIVGVAIMVYGGADRGGIGGRLTWEERQEHRQELTAGAAIVVCGLLGIRR